MQNTKYELESSVAIGPLMTGVLVQRSICEQIRRGLAWDEAWKSDDQGLIKAWEAGRLLQRTSPELADVARKDELPILPAKGGAESSLKAGTKFGSMWYLAMWQGLRDDDLHAPTEGEVSMTCSRTGVKVTYTWDTGKLG